MEDDMALRTNRENLRRHYH